MTSDALVRGNGWGDPLEVVRIQYYHRTIYAHCATSMTTAAPAGEPQVTHPARLARGSYGHGRTPGGRVRAGNSQIPFKFVPHFLF